eukprot:1642047-Rhodomonas_salina.3
MRKEGGKVTPCVVVCVCVQKDETLLHGAVRWEQQAVLEELLRQGADTELLSDGTAHATLQAAHAHSQLCTDHTGACGARVATASLRAARGSFEVLWMAAGHGVICGGAGAGRNCAADGSGARE